MVSSQNLAGHYLPLHMHVQLLLTIKAVKEKTKWPRNILNSRHMYCCLDYIMAGRKLSMHWPTTPAFGPAYRIGRHTSLVNTPAFGTLS